MDDSYLTNEEDEENEEDRYSSTSERFSMRNSRKMSAQEEKRQQQKAQQKKEQSDSVKKNFRSKVKARMALGMFTKAAKARQDTFDEDETFIFGAKGSPKGSPKDSPKGYHSPSRTSRSSSGGHSPPSLKLAPSLASRLGEENGKNKTRTVVRELLIPVHSTSVVLTKSGDPARYGKRDDQLFTTMHYCSLLFTAMHLPLLHVPRLPLLPLLTSTNFYYQPYQLHVLLSGMATTW